MNVEDFRLLYDYNSWANRRTLDACAALNNEQFTRDLGSSFPSVRDTLSHICGAEWIWLERWHGRSATLLSPWTDFPDLRFGSQPLGRSRARTFRLRALAHARRYAPRDRVQDHAKVIPNPQPLWQMLQHVANHSTYHRGQIATMLRQLGAKPVART